MKTAEVFSWCEFSNCAFQHEIDIEVKGVSKDSIASRLPSIEVYRYSDKKLIHSIDQTSYVISTSTRYTNAGESDLNT